jgi:hypothetical protein
MVGKRNLVKLALCFLALSASLFAAQVEALPHPQTGPRCCDPQLACRDFCARLGSTYFCAHAPSGSSCQSFCVCGQ